MSLRRAKQLIYFFFFALLWYGAVAGGYYLFAKPAVSCFDGIQNQNETGVDCGGVCAQACVPTGILPITLVPGEKIIPFQTDQEHISFLAHIENPNVSYATNFFTYHFSLYSDQGAVIQSYSGDSYIYGGELKYILLPQVLLPPGHIAKVDFTVDPPEWVPIKDFPGPPQIGISQSAPEVTTTTITINGEIVNNDTVIFPKATILAIFMGNIGEVAGVSQTEVDNISPNQHVPFSIIYPTIPNANLPATRILVYAPRQ